ncbi:MAG: hypothetical protein HY699_06265 [Deltaproteobacteria bacterium]|nr:hypothetical protein [Deltaproteobacteria bacterium]
MRCRWPVQVLLAMAAAAGAGCHAAVEDVPLAEHKISMADKFYDVEALTTERAIVVGYGGKILATENGGRSWTILPSGTDRGLYSVQFVDEDTGWISGQDGLMLHTTDGGKSWQRQDTGTLVYLFGLSFLDRQRGFAVGDRATMLETSDGGQNWAIRKLTQTGLTAEQEITAQDPVLYDVQFIDAQYGWLVGEFGKIYHSRDGGATFTEQQESLLGHGVFDVLDIPTFFAVHFINRREGYVAGLDGKIARTVDGGATWRFEPMQLEFPIVDPLFRAYPVGDGSVWAVGAAGEVVRRLAGASEWQRAQLGMEVATWLRGVDFVTPDNGWIVGGYGLILHTQDGGQTWLPALG